MKNRCKKAVHYNLPITIHLEDRDLTVSEGCIMFSDKMRDFLYNPLTDIAILIANGECKHHKKGLKYIQENLDIIDIDVVIDISTRDITKKPFACAV